MIEFLNHNKDAIIALGVFLTALTTVFGVYWTSRATHKTSASTMRERWIESLREEVAELVQRSLILDRSEHDSGFNSYEFLHENKKKITMIRLRLDLRNSDHSKLEEALVTYALATTNKEMDAAEEPLIQAAREVIRESWTKAARGQL